MIAFSKPISVSGLFSLLMMMAGPEMFSSAVLDHNSSEYWGSMSMAVGR